MKKRQEFAFFIAPVIYLVTSMVLTAAVAIPQDIGFIAAILLLVLLPLVPSVAYILWAYKGAFKND